MIITTLYYKVIFKLSSIKTVFIINFKVKLLDVSGTFMFRTMEIEVGEYVAGS